MTWMEWYNNLTKPSWTPSPSTISLIWMILYPIILISFGFVFVQAYRGKAPRRVAVPFAINLVANLLVHADLFGVAKCAAGGGGHRDRVGDDPLRHLRLAGLQMGCGSAGAVLRVGVHRRGPSIVHHGDELGEPVIRPEKQKRLRASCPESFRCKVPGTGLEPALP